MHTLPSESNPLVLVIDNDLTMRAQLRVFLTKEHYQVAEAGNSKEGLDCLIEQHPDLILLSANMPITDSFTCCQMIRKNDSGIDLPIVMLTELDDATSVVRAYEAGASDYMIKPVHWECLRQRIRWLIQNKYRCQKLITVNQLLQQFTYLDGLTQVANLRYFTDSLELEWRRMAREQSSLALILCGVDCFRNSSTIWGESTKDNWLYEIAQTINSIVKRPGDLVARYSNTEFAVILPRTDAIGAAQVAEKIRVAVHALNSFATLPLPDHDVTVSLGVASIVVRRDLHLDTLLTTADCALREALKRGDRIVLKSLPHGFVVH